MDKPTDSEIIITAALLEQLLCDFEPLDYDDMKHAEIAAKVARYWLTSHSTGDKPVNSTLLGGNANVVRHSKFR